MESVTMVLIFLFAVAVSRIFVRLLPLKFPLPLVQIGLGAALSFVGLKVKLDPEIFFLVFIPPLLFLDGWRIPKNALLSDWRSILTLALGLVAFTVMGIGYLIDSMVPAIPLAVAFAIAAIISPTDPLAVSAITSGTPVPSRLMHILEGESLLNDASGLVCFNFSVMAALTGRFSLADASLSFLEMAAGGLFIGVAISWSASATYHWLTRWIEEEPGTPILISILIPFAAYLAAEHLGASGILAAVAAGVSGHYANLIGRSSAVIRMRRSTVWDMLQVALNGIIFVLLGEQLPGILVGAPGIAHAIGAGSAWQLAAYAVAITLALAALRLVWVWASLETGRLLAPFLGKQPRPRRSARMVLVASLAGVKGAITLAGVLTLPFAMPDGSPFPARDLAIFLCVCVILLSLVAGSIGLPLLTKNLRLDDNPAASNQEKAARGAAAEAAIRQVEKLQRETPVDAAEMTAEAAARVIDLYRKRLDLGTKKGDEASHIKEIAAAERRFRVAALDAERDELYRLRLARQIDDPLHAELIREIDLMETSLPSLKRGQSTVFD
jgi:CPA1 family monovalent cation:H+ antiporter